MYLVLQQLFGPVAFGNQWSGKHCLRPTGVKLPRLIIHVARSVSIFCISAGLLVRSGHGARCTHGDGRGLLFQCCPDLSREVAGACVRSALRFKFAFCSVSLFIGSIQALKAPNAKCSQSKTEVLALKGRHFQQARDGMRTPGNFYFHDVERLCSVVMA